MPNLKSTQSTIDSGLDPNDNTKRLSSTESLDWEFLLDNSYSLEQHDLVLRMEVTDIQAIENRPINNASPSTLTFDNISNVEAFVTEGEIQNVNVFSSAKFSFFQKTEKIFGWSRVDAKQLQEIKSNFIVVSKEEVEYPLYFNVNLSEDLEVKYETNVNLHNHALSPIPVNSPHVKNIEIGEFTFPNRLPRTQEEKYTLRKKERLDKLTNSLSYPELITPPDPPELKYPDESISNVAKRFVEMFEMIKTAGSNRVDASYNETDIIFKIPGEFFKLEIPGQSIFLTPGGVRIPVDSTGRIIPEWQLPLNFTTQAYHLPLTIQPKVVQPNVSTALIPLRVASSLWLVLRQKEIGATVNAFYYGQLGRTALHKKINSRETVTVWTWDNVTAGTFPDGQVHFNVDLFVSNDTLRTPGFAGNSAALMVT